MLRSRSAEDALRVLHEYRGVNAIMIDLHMPGIDGWQFCRLLRDPASHAFGGIPLICVSSRLSPSDGQRVTAELGGHAFLHVPVEPRRLRTCVQQVLDGEALPSPLRALVIGESQEYAARVRRTLQDHGWIVHGTTSGTEARQILAEISPDLIVIHDPLPDITGLALLEEIRSRNSSVKPSSTL